VFSTFLPLITYINLISPQATSGLPWTPLQFTCSRIAIYPGVKKNVPPEKNKEESKESLQ
jgi:hypothetical protein